MSELEETFDSFYSDPRADIVLRSTSGRYYRVSSWNLSKQRCVVVLKGSWVCNTDDSTFFADLQGTVITATNEPIDVEVNNALVEAMLISVNVNQPITHRFRLCRLTVMEVVHLETFFDKFGFDTAKTVMTGEIVNRAKKDPWDLLAQASVHQLRDVAATATRWLLPGHVFNFKFWDNVRRLKVEWQSALIMAAFHDQIQLGTLRKVGSTLVSADWQCRYHSDELSSRFMANIASIGIP